MATVNLLPWREALREERKQEFLIILGVFIGISALLMLTMHLTVAQKIRTQQNGNQYMQQQILLVDKKLEDIAALRKQKEQLIAKMEIIQQLQLNRPMIVRVFDGLVRTVPNGLYLVEFGRQGNRLTIAGRAESNSRVSKFMRNIESSDWLTAPALSLIQAEKGYGADSNGFTLQATEVIPGNLAAKEVSDED